VDDRAADIHEALRFATGRAPVVIVTGGLGPTENDVTRETLSEFTAIPLREHPEVIEQMERRFGRSRDQLRANLRRQTQVPTRGTYLDNSQGSAVGLVFQTDRSVIVALPGPPRELQPMVRDQLIPYLSRRFGTRLPGRSITLRFVGIGQSQIDETIQQHVPMPADVAVSSQFEGGRVDFTFTLPHDTPSDRARLQELSKQILSHLGDYAYGEGDTTLEDCVVQMLLARGATIALAESGSGGCLAAALSSAKDSRRVLAGAFVAPTDEQLRRLLQVPDDRWDRAPSAAERAELVAAAVAEKAKSSWAIAVGQPQLDEGSSTRAPVVFGRPDGPMDHRAIPLGGDRLTVPSRWTTQVLDQLRRSLKATDRDGGNRAAAKNG
jgi:nicotinamide-nucleotide amidase